MIQLTNSFARHIIEQSINPKKKKSWARRTSFEALTRQILEIFLYGTPSAFGDRHAHNDTLGAARALMPAWAQQAKCTRREGRRRVGHRGEPYLRSARQASWWASGRHGIHARMHACMHACATVLHRPYGGGARLTTAIIL